MTLLSVAYALGNVSGANELHRHTTDTRISTLVRANVLCEHSNHSKALCT